MKRVIACANKNRLWSYQRFLSSAYACLRSSALRSCAVHRGYNCSRSASKSSETISTVADFEQGTSSYEREERNRNDLGGHNVCAAYCAHTPLSLNSVARYFAKEGELRNLSGIRVGQAIVESDAKDVLRVTVLDDSREMPPESSIFYFRSGAIVFWGVPLPARKQLLAETQHFARDLASDHDRGERMDCVSESPKRVDSLDALFTSDGISSSGPLRPIKMEEFEHEFLYFISDKRNGNRASFRNDRIFLNSTSDFSEMLAISYGLAQSVKLHVHEVALDALVQRTESLPVELAHHGRISLSATDIRKLIGELLAARYSVNLVSDILDTPEYFWHRPELERLYVECTAAVELRQRSKILDARAEVIKDSLHILNSELAAASSMRLERAILFLIGIEVLFEVTKFV